MACTSIGFWSFSALSPSGLCSAPLSLELYSDTGGYTAGTVVASGCPTSNFAVQSGYYSNGIDIIIVDVVTPPLSQVITVSSCPTPTPTPTQTPTNSVTPIGNYCIINNGSFDGNYNIDGVYNGYNYYSGSTGFIFFSIPENRWCLAMNLGDPCVQFGPYASSSLSPDLDDTVMYSGICVTTTTTTNPCASFDFDAVFDCYNPPTPSITPTYTSTPTLTPTPTPTEPCGGRTMSVVLLKITPSATSTPTPTPSRSPIINRPCDVSGQVIFNSINEIIQCANSKKFKDCFTGIDYFTSDLVLVSGTTQPKEGFVYNATINGENHCVVFEGLFENISGVDNINLTNEIGHVNAGSCLNCTPPTPNPISECLVISSECGVVNVNAGSFINGKISYTWNFPNIPQSIYLYEIYWDSLNGRWVCKETTTNQVGAYLYIDSELPVGSQLEWDYQNTPFDSTDCIEELTGFFTYTTSNPCPTPSSTPTPTPSPTPCFQNEYRIQNNSQDKISIQYTECFSKNTKSKSLSGGVSIIICSSTTPVSNNPQNTVITQLPTTC